MREIIMNTPESSKSCGNRGRTALITGASSGLGEVFARRLAARGYNLLLTARREERLNKLRHELEAEHSITAEVFVADLTRADDLDRLTGRINSLDSLEMLVNNAGFGVLGSFVEIDAEGHADMIQVHVVAAVRLTRAALPKMIDRGTGAIINVSSVAGFRTAGSVIYSATKACLTSFSQLLHTELNGSGVRVQALCPGLVYTGFHDTPDFESFERSRIPEFLWLSADYVVDASLKALARNRAVCIPSWRYRLLVALMTNPLSRSIVWGIYRRRVKK